MNLNNIPDTECKCKICVEMCRDVPCWGTPDDIQALINAGYRNKLKVQYWKNGLTSTYIVIPTSKEHKRCCIFLENDLCMLHDKGLKPTEARKVLCSKPPIGVHNAVALTWNTFEGRNLASEFMEDK